MSARTSKLVSAGAALAATLLISLEGFSSTPYLDSAGVLTECFGNTHNVAAGTVKDEAQCKTVLVTEVGRIGQEIAQDDAAHADAMSIQNLAAMISWTYNVGDGAYRTSTARKYLLAGNYTAMCHELPKWKYITVRGLKVVSPGLVNRRAKEEALCLST